MSVPQPSPLLRRLATSPPERPVFEVDGEALTWADLDARSRAYAATLAERGLVPGDRVAVYAGSSTALLVALVGHLRAGVVHVPINTRYREAEVDHVLTDSGASLLVADRDVPTDLDVPTHRLDALDLAGDAPAPPGVDPDATAMLIYTSGTTGRSKGVMLSHRALAANVGATTGLWRFSENDRLVLVLPLFHVHGLGLGVLGTLLHGGVAEVHARFDPVHVIDAMRRGGTVFMGVPTMYARLLAWLDAHPADADALRGARLFTSGSAALPAAQHEAFERATGCRILERYGMSETGFTLSNPYDRERRAGTVGFPVPGYDVRIVDEADADVADGETGELLVRGDGLLTAYWRRPDATAAAFVDGWFRTGDVARRDADGYHVIVGRRSVDILKSGGFKLSAREIEDVLLTHPALAEAAVVGVPDPDWGEAIAAAVVLAAGATLDAPLATLQAFVSERLADYKKPRHVKLVDALPRNALGKVQKHRLRPAFQLAGAAAVAATSSGSGSSG